MATKKTKKEEAPVMFGANKVYTFRLSLDHSPVQITLDSGVFRIKYRTFEKFFSDLRSYQFIFEAGGNSNYSINFMVGDRSGESIVDIPLARFTQEEEKEFNQFKEELFEEVKRL